VNEGKERDMAGPVQSPISHHSRVRVKIDEGLMKDVISSDTFLEAEDADERAKRIYEHNCNRRELKLYNLLRKMVHDFNRELSSTRIRLRIVEEGEGLYLEMDI